MTHPRRHADGRYRFSWEKPERDPEPSKGADWPRAFVGLSVLGVGLWGLWRFTSEKAKTPIAPDPDVAPMSKPGGATSNELQAGDLVLVKASFLEKALGLHLEVDGLVFKISIALPSLPSVTASPAAPIPLDGAPPFTGPMVVPRSEILRRADPAPSPSPASPPSGGPALVYLSDPIPLSTGKRYRARLSLDGMQATFANEGLVKAQFEGLGFTDVKAWKEPSALPADWPATEKTNEGGGKTWFVEGRWSGTPTQLPKPPGVAKAWEG